MSQRRPTFASNAVVTVATQMTALAVGLFASILISRVLGPDGRGAYYVPVTAVTVTFALGHLSIEMAVRYFYAERGVDLRALARVSATAAMLIGTAGVMLLAGPWLLGIDEIEGVATANLALAALALPFTLHATWLMNVFALAHRVPRSQLALLTSVTFHTVLLVALWALDELTVESVLLAYVVAAAVNWILLVTWSRAFAPAIPSADRALLKEVVGHGVRIHAGYVAFFLLLRSDVFLVQFKLGVHEVGVYSVVVLFAELTSTVTSAIAVAGLPFQSSTDRMEGATATFQTVRTCLLVASVLALLSTATMWCLLPLLYGEAFSAAYGPMVALLPGVVAMATIRPLWNWLVRDGHPRPITILFIVGLALNVGLNLLLLEPLGLYGASLASSVSYALIAVVLASMTIRSSSGGPGDFVPKFDDLRAGSRALRAMLSAIRRRPSTAPATSSVD